MASTGFTSVFDKNATAVEKLMGGMMALQGVMNLVKAASAAMQVVEKTGLITKIAGTSAT
jgi:hypothetical protein